MLDGRIIFVVSILIFIICIITFIIYTGKNKKSQSILDFTKNTQSYVINLEKNSDRLASFVDRYEKSDMSLIPLQRFNAVYGKDLDLKPLVTEEAYKQIMYAETNGYRLRHYELTRGAVGCFLSHMTLYNKLLDDQNKNFYIIFEDDTIVPPKVIDKVELYIKHAPEDWDILLFGTIRQVVTHQNPLYYKVKSWWGLFGYAIKKEGADKFIKEYDSQGLIDKQIDSMMSMMAVENKLNVYSTRHALFTTDGSITEIQLPVKLAKNIDPFKYEGVAL